MNITRNKIIEAALRKIGVYDQGETIPAQDLEEAAFALNLMIKEWSADPNMKLWQRKEGFLFTNPGQKDYFLGQSLPSFFGGRAVFCSRFFESYNFILDDSERGSPSNPVVVISSVISRPDNEQYHENWGIINGEEAFFGAPSTEDIPLPGRPAGTLGWIEGTVEVTTSGEIVFDPAGSAIMAPPEGINSVVVLKRDLLNKPLKITTMSRVRYSSNSDENDINQIDTPIDLVALSEYNMLSMKYSSGPPTLAYYEPKVSEGFLRLWPNNDSSVYVVRIYFDAELKAYEDLTDDTQFPPEWYNVLVWGLGAELAAEYSLPLGERQYISEMAMYKKMNMMAFDEEQGSLYWEMDFQGRR